MKSPFPIVRYVLAALLAAPFAAPVCASAQQAAKPAPDVLVFTNGDQLTGKFERGDGGNITFKSDMAGEITVALAKVKELRSSGGFAVLKKEAKLTRTPPAVQGTVHVTDGNISVTPPSGATPQVVPAKDVAFIIDDATFEREVTRRPGFTSGWHGALNGGATLVRSTTDAETYTAGIALIRTVPTVAYLPSRNRTTFDLQETYGKLTTPDNPVAGLTYSQVKTSIFHADAERDEYFSPRLYALAATSFDHNYAQGLSLQAVYGAGLGWTPVKGAKQQLDLKADLHYERQSFLSLTAGVDPQPGLNLIGSTISDVYRRNLPRKLVFTQTASILPAFNDAKAYAANATAMLVLPVYKRLAAQFATTDNYLNDPAPGFKKNSYQFTTGVTYTLK